jgi:hypothetical protein
LSLKKFFFPFVFGVVSLVGSSPRADELNIHFKTTPPVELIPAFAEPIDLSLLITGADGRPIKQGTVRIRLDAPRPGRFFSTDIPLVEGTLLNEMRLPLRQGRANWKQLFPIRGNYRLTVDVASADGSTTAKTLTFKVRESRMKWLALTAFSAALFLLGFIAGRVFTRAGGGVVSGVLVAAILVALPGISRAQQQGDTGDAAALEIEPATVGRPSTVRWKLMRTGTGEQRAALLSLSITHLEKHKLMFAVDKIAVPGEWSMRFHFPDGAEYRVAAVASVAGMAPLSNEEVVAVTGVEPSTTATLPVLSFFTALIAMGLGVGRWSKRRDVVGERAMFGKRHLLPPRRGE